MDNVIVLVKNPDHIHCSRPGKIIVEETLAEMKKRAATTGEFINVIYNWGLSRITDRNWAQYLPQDSAIRRALHRA